jgi:hypothetical protein
VALQQTTRELWAQQGPFKQYTIHGVPQQNIPAVYIKGAIWNTQADPPRYVAQSSAPEESFFFFFLNPFYSGIQAQG